MYSSPRSRPNEAPTAATLSVLGPGLPVSTRVASKKEKVVSKRRLVFEPDAYDQLPDKPFCFAAGQSAGDLSAQVYIHLTGCETRNETLSGQLRCGMHSTNGGSMTIRPSVPNMHVPRSFTLHLVWRLPVSGWQPAVRWQGFPISDMSAFPWRIWGGGFFATVDVLAIFRSAPRIGVVTLVAAVDFGQLAATLIMDATCAFGLVAREITPTRILLVVMVTGGLPVSGFSSERLAPNRFVRVCLRWPALTGLTAQVNLSDMRCSELLHFRSYPVRLAQ